MKLKEQIKQKYLEFQAFLDSVDINMLNTLSREELDTLKKELYDIKIRSLPYEIGQLADAKKKEEFPQLLGVYRYPLLNNIDFLSDTAKIELDKYLGSLRVGNYVRGYRVTHDNKIQKQLDDFLLQNGIVEKVGVIKCPYCGEDHLTKTMPYDEAMKLLEGIKNLPDDYEEAEKIAEGIQQYCTGCDSSFELDEMKEIPFGVTEYLILKMERDTTLDNA